MQKTITKRAVDALKPGELIADTELRGFIVRRLPSGRLTYGLRYTKDGRRRWLAVGVGLAPQAAREAAAKFAGSVAKDENPMTDRADRRRRALAARTLDNILDEFLKEHVRARGLRTNSEIESLLDRYVRPVLGSRPVGEIKRSEIVALLDEISDRKSSRSEDGKSRRVADKVLGVLRSALNWHATRDDDFRTPIVAGMARTSLRELTRDRILSDDEIRDLWSTLDDCKPDASARIVRVLLLSGARLNEIARLQWSEIDDASRTLTVPASRCKAKIDHTLPILPGVAALFPERAKDSGEFLFSTDGGDSPFSGFSKAKARLDKAIDGTRVEKGLEPMRDWRLHDLRRTARSLMSRAGVTADIAERVLGHVLPGVRGIYDRHTFLAEKRDALEKLAALLEAIISPPADNVVPLRASR